MSFEALTQKNFATVSDCYKIITNIEDSMFIRSKDRAMINAQFNGNRPFSPEEEKELQIQVNANFLEGYRIAQNGILQMNTALLYKERLFNAKLIKGKPTKRQEWSENLTNNIHIPLQRGRSGKKFDNVMVNRNASLTVHGIGALWWSNSWDWMPKFVALDDLLIPTDSTLDFDDELGYFGVNQWLTPWQLFKMTHGPNVDPGWNKELVREAIKSMLETQNYSPDYWDKPEKMEELWKQRSAYLNSDAVAKVKITTIYFQDTDTGEWWRKIVLRENQALNLTSISADKFLYESKFPFADSIDKILHMQFGDGSVVAPFKYRSVRGLGVLLFPVIELMNRLRCQFTQSVFTDLIPLLRIENPTDRDRPRMLQLQPYGVVEQGVSFITQQERHQPQYQLVTAAMNEYRQLMSESSASYVQDIDTGTGKEMTLGEAQIRLQSVNRMVASMLMVAYKREAFLYEEILRRFFDRTSHDPEVKKFQERCKADGIPDDLMNVECWQINITRAFGAGDQTLAQQEATALMNVAPQLDADAQRIVKRNFISVMTRNPELANTLVPEQPTEATAGRLAAEDCFGTLMAGGPVVMREGIEQSEYITAMLQMMGAVVQQISETDNMGTTQQVIGLQMVAQDISRHLMLLANDQTQKEFVTAAGKELGKLMNFVKAFEQRQQDAAQKNNPDPETMAKIQADQLAALVKAQNSQAAAEQKLAQREAQFAQKMEQDQQRFALQMQQQMAEFQQQLAQQQAKAIADIQVMQEKAAAQPITTAEA